MTKKLEKKRKLTWKETLDLYWETFRDFFKENTFIHSASLSYYTIFTLVPVIYLSIVTFGKVIGQKTMVEIISSFLKENIGIQDMTGIIEFLNQTDFEQTNFFMQTIVIITLLLSSTALFNSLKYSINEFFGVEKKFETNRKAIIYTIFTRLTSFALLTFFGLVLVLTYFFETVLISFGSKLFSNLSSVESFFVVFTQHSLAIFSNILIFLLIFKYLHDAYVPWKMALAGSVFTSVLLYLGQLLIKYYLTNYFFARDSGFAGTILVILTWMFYSSQIIFLGAKFTAIYAKKLGRPLRLA